MTNEQILQVAMQQSAWDINCDPNDFLKTEHVLVKEWIGEKARKYYKEPIACNLVSYGNNIVALRPLTFIGWKNKWNPWDRKFALWRNTFCQMLKI